MEINLKKNYNRLCYYKNKQEALKPRIKLVLEAELFLVPF